MPLNLRGWVQQASSTTLFTRMVNIMARVQYVHAEGGERLGRLAVRQPLSHDRSRSTSASAFGQRAPAKKHDRQKQMVGVTYAATDRA
jgi:hypothetical protein